MNLKEALLEEHSKTQTDKIVRYVGNDKNRFSELMKLFLGDEYRITQRAAWPLSYCAEEHSELIRPYFKKLIENLDKPNLHDAVKRNTMRLFQFIDVPDDLQGKLIDKCFQYIQSMDEPVAVRAFALTVAERISREFPELKQELILIAKDQMEYSDSPAIKSRCKAILKEKKAV
jgi:hypothetical protein